MFVRSFIAAAVLAAALPAGAVTITGLYSTGVDNAGVATTGNGADLHWTVDGGTAYTGGTNGVYPIGPWLAETATSRWLTPTTSAGDNVAAGPYVYTTTFSLAGLNAATAQFSGQFAADDFVSTVTLNGVVLPISGGGFTFYTGFASTGGVFLAGTNTLSFTSVNGGGPAGFRVEIAGTADALGAVPEAATWTMMIAGFGLVGVGLRRRSGAVAA